MVSALLPGLNYGGWGSGTGWGVACGALGFREEETLWNLKWRGEGSDGDPRMCRFQSELLLTDPA